MRYIQRDIGTGEMLGHYACPQEFETELVSDDHREIIAWAAKYEAIRQQSPIKDLEARITVLEHRMTVGMNA